MASEIYHNSSKGSGVDFRPKGFFESRGWSRSKRNPSPTSEASPPVASREDQQPSVSPECGADSSANDYQFLFGRVWQTGGAPGTSPSSDATATASQQPRAFEGHTPKSSSSSSSWRRYGFKRSGGSGDSQKNGTPSPKSSLERPGKGHAKESVSPEYTTVSVGEGKGKRVQYSISTEILRHHLFQVILKCSHGDVEQEEDQSSDACVYVNCNPALFLQLVRVVGGEFEARI